MSSPIESFRDLRVWQAAMTLVTGIYQATDRLPGEERYGLISQMRRAAVSIPSNIAEGHRRESTKEYLHRLSIAQGSLAEIETQVEIGRRLNYLDSALADRLVGECQDLARQLFALRNALGRRLNPRPPTPAA